MPHYDILKTLHPLEVHVLLNFEEGEIISFEKAIEKLSFNFGQYNQATAWLLSKQLIQEDKSETTLTIALTEMGKKYQIRGTPEENMFRLLQEQGSMTIPEMALELNMEKSDVGAAYGALSKDKYLSMDESNRIQLTSEQLPRRITNLRGLVDKFSGLDELDSKDITDEERQLVNTNSRKRGSGKGIFRVAEREIKSYGLTKKGNMIRQLLIKEGISGDDIGQVTPEMLKDASWKGQSFRSYNLDVPPKRLLLGRKNAYGEFLEKLKDKLVSFGFQEFDGPLIEPEFWNADALYMPQFHSARDIHDVYYIKGPEYSPDIEEPYLSQVALTHENGWKTGSIGWGYAFDKQRTHRLVLRSQGTVLSAKTLTQAKIPGKYFGVVRCFRYDQTDATHLVDFYQTEGIVLGEHVNFRTLLGLLKMFAREVTGATDIKYVPGYFPFTEPSVEVHIKHPALGWYELGGAGIFRPEVTLPLGVSVPVIAWGLGIDRMALMSLGLNDVRDLFTNDIEYVRLRRRNN